MINSCVDPNGYFKIGKIYQNITKHESWPLYAVEIKDIDEYQSEYAKRKGYIHSGDTFVALEELHTTNYLHLKILAEDGMVYRTAILNNIKHLVTWFEEVTIY